MATEYTEAIENILKDILGQLPGVIRSVAANEVRLCMREFFEKSLAWTKEVESVSIPTGDTAIQVDDSDANTEVIAVMGVKIGNSTDGYSPITPLGGMPDKIEGSNGRPYSWYITSNPDEFKLHTYNTDASTADDLRVLVGLMPALDVAVDSQTLPRQITLKYKDAILNGTLSRLYMQPNKPYTQPVLGTQLRHNFLRQIGYYAGQRKKGYNNTPQWRYPVGWRK